MDVLDAYNIPFKGLADGEHRFEFRVDGAFFEVFDVEDGLEKTIADFTVNMLKKPTLFELDIRMQASCELPCDRCGQPFDMKTTADDHWIVKFGTEEEDDIIVIPHEEHTLRLAQVFYETIVLAMPVRRVHPNDGCDDNVLALLEQNIEDQENTPDPRWDALRALQNDKKKG